MTREEAINIVVKEGRDGQKELLKALIEEMPVGVLEETLFAYGYVPQEDDIEDEPDTDE